MTETCHQLGHTAYCDALEREIARLADVARELDLEATVPTCPEWTGAVLLEHIGGIHRWAGTMVATLAPERLRREQLDLGLPDDPAGLPDWIAAGADVLVPALRKADPEAAMWAWGSDPHVRFWSRRMLHETTVHRADAEIALGRDPAIDADVAVDGVDEFLDNLPHAKYFAPRVEELRGEGGRVRFACPETVWTIALVPDGITWSHDESDAADVTVTADAADVLLFVYGRRGPASVTGDRALLERWIANSSI
jgi:uncharacterized protein (TIGR03083 family)